MKELRATSDIGNYYDFLQKYCKTGLYTLSSLSVQPSEFEEWKAEARKIVRELLWYEPREASLDAEILSVTDCGSYRQEEVEFNTAADVRVKGTLLIPQQGEGPFPAVVALHDHSAVYYFGREKIVEQNNEPAVLSEFKKDCYGGRSWANELVKRGYVVLAIDAFYFGSRRVDPATVSDRILAQYGGVMTGSGTDSIESFNRFCQRFEGLLVKHILASGTTWPGILFHDDRKSIDYLCTRKEVDPDRIGCCGLSIGGYRSVFLAALDERIKCSVVAGWMSSYDSLMFDGLNVHTYMVYIPGLARYLDLPDIAVLTAPNPLLVQQCMGEELYGNGGMQKACKQIKEVYGKLKCPDRYASRFYDNKHAFTVNMQEDAFAWLDRWLKDVK